MVRRNFWLKTFVLFLAYAINSTAWALTSVSATVDKNPVVVNESFVLEVVADDDVDNNSLDTSPLLKDFIVGRSSVSSQTSMVNFKTSRTTRFQVLLIAKKAGTVVIPALTIDGKQSQPITLTVLEQGDATAEKSKNLFITSEISAKEVYVQQQITLTVKLHFAAELKRGSLSEPSLAGAAIRQIGQDKEQDTIINGRRFRVIERTYAINPQQSGEFELVSPVFSGEVMVPSARRSNFLSFGETKPVSVMGENIALSVKAIPANYQGAWLPSELLTIHQEWQPDIATFKVGEPITRTVTLTAAGLSQEQLPKIDMPMTNGLKIYPDQAELHTGMNRGRLVSQKVQNFAIVASKPGDYVLPEVRIPWWNTVTNKMQFAIIPAQKVSVQPNPELVQEQQNSAGDPSISAAKSKPITITMVEYSKLQWLFLALWLLTALGWWLSSRRNAKTLAELKAQMASQGFVVSGALGSSTNGANNRFTAPSDISAALITACKNSDSKQALNLIVPWANSVKDANVKEITTLDEVKAAFDSRELAAAINVLQQSNFAKEPTTWHGDKLATVVKTIEQAKQNTSTEDNSFSLNP